jgi:hypothetical protein
MIALFDLLTNLIMNKGLYFKLFGKGLRVARAGTVVGYAGGRRF